MRPSSCSHMRSLQLPRKRRRHERHLPPQQLHYVLRRSCDTHAEGNIQGTCPSAKHACSRRHTHSLCKDSSALSSCACKAKVALACASGMISFAATTCRLSWQYEATVLQTWRAHAVLRHLSSSCSITRMHKQTCRRPWRRSVRELIATSPLLELRINIRIGESFGKQILSYDRMTALTSCSLPTLHMWPSLLCASVHTRQALLLLGKSAV